jgi:hypothetical protein
MKSGILGYVILLPLVNRGNVNIYRLIPIRVPLDRTEYLYIDTGKLFLRIDQARLLFHDGKGMDGLVQNCGWCVIYL